MAKVAGSVHWMQVGSVATMFDFHTSVLAEINIISPCFTFLKVVLNPHEHVESLIGLLLAVFDAFDLRLVLGSSEIKVDAVFVALFEKELGQCVLPIAILKVVRVATPVSGRTHCLIKL